METLEKQDLLALHAIHTPISTQQIQLCHWPVTLLASAAKSLQSCLTLRDPMDHSFPGSSASGVSQAGVLEWVAVFSSTGGL